MPYETEQTMLSKGSCAADQSMNKIQSRVSLLTRRVLFYTNDNFYEVPHIQGQIWFDHVGDE